MKYLRKVNSWWSQAPQSLSEAFDYKRNSIGFLRFFFATLVIFNHSFPLGGYGSVDWVARFSQDQESLGGIAVKGFFILSGFLIAGSLLRTRSVLRYLWHRFLRIMPGFWVCLLITAFVFAPLMMLFTQGHVSGFTFTNPTGPMSYIYHNSLLNMRQYDISGLTANLPFPHAFDGSLWTLIYEAIGYLTIAGLGFFALLKDKGKLVLGGVVLIYFIFLANIAVPGVAGKIFTPFRDIELITLLLFFLVGTAFYLFREKIIISNKFIVLTFLACVLGARYGFYTSIGPVLFSYFVLYMACKLPIMNFDKRADISYGIYIYAFPVQQLLSAKGINRYSYYVYTLSVCVITFALATLSYFCVERPFLRLKNVKIKGTSVAVRRFLQWERNQY